MGYEIRDFVEFLGALRQYWCARMRFSCEKMAAGSGFFVTMDEMAPTKSALVSTKSALVSAKSALVSTRSALVSAKSA